MHHLHFPVIPRTTVHQKLYMPSEMPTPAESQRNSCGELHTKNKRISKRHVEITNGEQLRCTSGRAFVRPRSHTFDHSENGKTTQKNASRKNDDHGDHHILRQCSRSCFLRWLLGILVFSRGTGRKPSLNSTQHGQAMLHNVLRQLVIHRRSTMCWSCAPGTRTIVARLPSSSEGHHLREDAKVLLNR